MPVPDTIPASQPVTVNGRTFDRWTICTVAIANTPNSSGDTIRVTYIVTRADANSASPYPDHRQAVYSIPDIIAAYGSDPTAGPLIAELEGILFELVGYDMGKRGVT